jgi:hypothetical protein
MKRRELIEHLEGHGCEFLREGGNHTTYPDSSRTSLQKRSSYTGRLEAVSR